MGHETADLVDRVGVEQVHNFWAAHSAVRFRHSRLRVHGGYLSGRIARKEQLLQIAQKWWFLAAHEEKHTR
jgi:hypothetical protein